MSVRARAEVLVADPSQYSLPIPQYKSLGEAKTEADAYLAICGHGIINALVGSAPRQERFQSNFNTGLKEIKKLWGDDVPPRPALINDEFLFSFGTVYADKALVSAVMHADRPLSKKAIAVCGAYADMAESHYARQGIFNQGVPEHRAYYTPATLITQGFGTYEKELEDQLKLLGESDLTPTERLTALAGGTKFLMSMGSLSIEQLRQANSSRPGTVSADRVETVADFTALRKTAVYASNRDAELRPKNMCPLMPELQTTGAPVSGSGIRKLAQHVLGLYEGANMHMLGVDFAAVGFFSAEGPVQL